MVRAIVGLTAASLAAAVALLPATHAAPSFRSIAAGALELQALDDEGLQVRNTLTLVGARQNAGEYGYESVECELGDWQNTTDCDPLTLTQKFVRPVKTAPSGDGAACAEVTEVRKCQPVHCHVGEWSEWSDCLEDGYKERTREILQEPLYGGRACPHYLDRVKCRPEDCLVCHWSAWQCDPATGRQNRTREVVRKKRLQGKPCPPLVEEKECDPIDCELSDEYDDEWTECDANDDRHQFRKVARPARFGGRECPPPEAVWKTDKDACAPKPCAVASADDVAFGECEFSETANVWTKRKVLDVTQQPKYGGAPCPSLEDRTIVEECAPVDCVVASERDVAFGECVEDGESRVWLKQKVLDITQAPLYGGASCPSLEDRTLVEVCPKVDCVMATEWQVVAGAECQADGTRAQTLPVATQTIYGPPCEPRTRDFPDPDACPPQDCVLQDDADVLFGDGTCELDATVGTWVQRGERQILQPPVYGGKACPKASARQVVRECVPVDCVVERAEDVAFSPCVENTTSHEWFKSKTLTIVTPAANGGAACPSSLERTLVEKCEPVPCAMGPWVFEGACNAHGMRQGKRLVLAQALYGAPLCSEQECLAPDPVACKPVDCEEYAEHEVAFGQCKPRRAGRPTRRKVLQIKTQPRFGGRACRPLSERTVEVLCDEA